MKQLAQDAIKKVLALDNLPYRVRSVLGMLRVKNIRGQGSAEYWESRYCAGGNSGSGSYGKLATFKSTILNDFVSENMIASVIELGCGDGNQLGYAKYPRYLGFDVSSYAVDACRQRFAHDEQKSFQLMSDYRGERADLAISLDVIYHLVEDDVFVDYMCTLFNAAARFVIVYSSNTDDNIGYEGTHVKHRRFTDWVAANRPDWQFVKSIPNAHPYRGDYRQGSFAEFFVYRRTRTDRN